MIILCLLIVALFVLAATRGMNKVVAGVTATWWISYLTLAGPYLFSAGSTWLVLIGLLILALLSFWTYLLFSGGFAEVSPDISIRRGED